MPRWKTDSRWCQGSKDPSAPHDLEADGARTSQGKCRACKLYSNRAQKKRTRGTSVPIEEAERIARDVRVEDRGRPVHFHGPLTPNVAGAWRASVREGQAVTPFAALVDEWPGAEDDSPLPCAPEVWDGDEEEERTSAAALFRLAHDPSNSLYNRRLALAALRRDYR